MRISRRILSLGAGAAVMLAAVLSVPAAPKTAASAVGAGSRFEVIRGVVSARTDGSLTVDNAVIDMPSTVYCTHDGTPIMPEDIRVGDRVRLVAFYDAAHGTRLAQSIRDLGQSD